MARRWASPPTSRPVMESSERRRHAVRSRRHSDRREEARRGLRRRHPCLGHRFQPYPRYEWLRYKADGPISGARRTRVAFRVGGVAAWAGMNAAGAVRRRPALSGSTRRTGVIELMQYERADAGPAVRTRGCWPGPIQATAHRLGRLLAQTGRASVPNPVAAIGGRQPRAGRDPPGARCLPTDDIRQAGQD